MILRTDATRIDPHDWPRGLAQAVTSLGDPLSVHRIPAWLTQVRFLGSFTFLFLSILLFLLVATSGRLEYLIVAIPLMLTSFSLGWNGLRERGLWVLIFPTGLVCWKRGHISVFAWHEIWEVYVSRVSRGAKFFAKADATGEPECAWLEFTKLPRILGPQLRLVRHDQAQVTLSSSLEGFAELSQHIQQMTFLPAWDYCDLAFRSKRQIWFGKLKVSPICLSFGRRYFAWKEINDILIAGGYLQVRTNGHWKPLLTFPLETIPNPHVLLALVALSCKTIINPDPKKITITLKG